MVINIMYYSTLLCLYIYTGMWGIRFDSPMASVKITAMGIEHLIISIITLLTYC